MKKLILSLVGIMGFLFPLLSQVDNELTDNEVIPVESLTLKKEQIPAPIVKAVNDEFVSAKAFKYGEFPYVLEKYGWIVDKDEADKKPDHYEVYIKANDGSDIFAIYSPDGTIIQSKAIIKNGPLPSSVMKALFKSQYKDWNVVGDKEVIKYFNSKDDVEEHFLITVEKNNIKKHISFNYKEPAAV